jgi:hypothetical protein
MVAMLETKMVGLSALTKGMRLVGLKDELTVAVSVGKMAAELVTLLVE